MNGYAGSEGGGRDVDRLVVTRGFIFFPLLLFFFSFLFFCGKSAGFWFLDVSRSLTAGIVG